MNWGIFRNGAFRTHNRSIATEVAPQIPAGGSLPAVTTGTESQDDVMPG
jgi:hypothetical protein